MLSINLRAPTIAPSQRVWRLFPGESYQFLQSFQDQKVGFLDLPGLELPPSGLKLAPDLIARIARVHRIQELLRDAPDSDLTLPLAEFANARVTQARTRLRNALINFYEEAKTGDLVALPEPVHLSRIWIGQFSGRL